MDIGIQTDINENGAPVPYGVDETIIPDQKWWDLYLQTYVDFKAELKHFAPQMPPLDLQEALLTCKRYVHNITHDSPLDESFSISPEWQAYIKDVSEYIQGIGIRIIPPVFYVSAQTAMIILAENQQINVEAMSMLQVGTALACAHLFNFTMEYLVLRQGGTPINPVALPLRRIIDAMATEDQKQTIEQCAAAISIIAAKIGVLEGLKLAGNVLQPEWYKAAALTITAAMLIEGILNGTINLPIGLLKRNKR